MQCGALNWIPDQKKDLRWKLRKSPKCPLMDKGINKMWNTHTMEYYLTLKRKKIWTHATMQMNQEDMMLLKRTGQRSAVWSHTSEVSRLGTSLDTERRMVVTRGWGERKSGSCLMGVKLPFCKVKRAL